MAEALSVVAVVGAGLAGLRACETLRAHGFEGRVVLVGGEEHLPYDRPPLSKQVLSGEWEPARCLLKTESQLDDLGIEMYLGRRAERLDLDARRVELSGGSTIAFDRLVIASGARPRLLPGITGRPGVLTLRTIEDAMALRAVIQKGGARIVVAGGGFVGLEVAATARRAGAEVTVVEPLSAPLERAFGATVGAAFAALHRDHGVEIRTSTGLEGVTTSSGVCCELSDGTAVEADVLLVGIGAVPDTAWLESSGLELDRSGVVCDERLVAAPGVVAAGDVASWRHGLTGEQMRVEHRTNAAEQGEHAARTLLDPGRPDAAFAPVPYVWSDQYDRKIQMLGSPHGDDLLTVVEGALSQERFVVLYERRGRLTGVLSSNRPRALMAYRALLERAASFEEALALTRE